MVASTFNKALMVFICHFLAASKLVFRIACFSNRNLHNHLNPAVFIPPVSDEEEVTDNKRKWKNRDEKRKIVRGI